MVDYDRILVVKKAAQAKLLALPGVHAVGIGAKYVKGKPTPEPAIIVYTTKKRPLYEIPTAQVIPPVVDGIKTDVIEAGIPQDLAVPDLDADQTSYLRMRGGLQIQTRGGLGGTGTLGFIAHTLDPVPKIVAVTCRHVVGAASRQATGLTGTFNPPAASPTTGPFTLTFSGTLLPGTEIVVNLEVTPSGGSTKQELNVFWTTTGTDTLVAIAKAVAQEIANLNNPAVKSATWSGPGAGVLIRLASSFSCLPTCYVLGPVTLDKNSKLTATIASTNITLGGSVAGDNYGVFTSWNTAGSNASDGIFFAAVKNQSSQAVAAALASAINAIPNTGVSVPTPTGADFTISGAQEVECNITSDTRVGQADDTYCSSCCYCCGQQLGRVIASRLNVDVALVQLKSGLKYGAQIEEIGVVDSSYTVTKQDVTPGPYPVEKRGRSTGHTKGTVHALNIDGQTNSRNYTNAMSIASATADAFSDEGDSGSAVVSVFMNSLNNPACKIVGLLFGRDTGSGFSFATPVDQVTAALGIALETATVPDDWRKVTDASGVAAIAPGPDTAIAGGALTIEAGQHWEQLQRVQQEITATSGGQKFAALVQHHVSEVQTLVNTNRRVATVWHRNGGPQIVRGLLRMADSSEAHLPSEIQGKPLTECMKEIQKVFARYGSRELAADLDRHGPSIADLAQLTYPEVLAALSASEASQTREYFDGR